MCVNAVWIVGVSLWHDHAVLCWPLRYVLRRGAFVNEIHNGEIRDSRIGGKADFAGAAVGISCFAVFHLVAQFAQGVFVKFWMSKTFVTGEGAASNAVWYGHIA